jgi:hypothetical protein
VAVGRSYASDDDRGECNHGSACRPWERGHGCTQNFRLAAGILECGDSSPLFCAGQAATGLSLVD